MIPQQPLDYPVGYDQLEELKSAGEVEEFAIVDEPIEEEYELPLAS